MEESKDLISIIKEIENVNPVVLKKISQRQISKVKILNKGSRFKKGELRGKEFTLENGLKFTVKFDDIIGKKTQNFVFVNGGLIKAKEAQKELRELLKTEKLSVKEKRAALILKKALDEYIEYRKIANKSNKLASKKIAMNNLEKINPIYLKQVKEKIDAFYAKKIDDLSDEEQKELYTSFIAELEEEKRRITQESKVYQEKLNEQLGLLELLKSTTSDYTSQKFIDSLQEISNNKNSLMPVLDNMAKATDLINSTVKDLKVKVFPIVDETFSVKNVDIESDYVFEDRKDVPFINRYKINFHSIGRFFYNKLNFSQRRLLRQASYAAEKYGEGASIDDLNIFTKFFSGLPFRGNNQRAMRSLDIETVDPFSLFEMDEEDVEELREKGYLIQKLRRKSTVTKEEPPIIDLSKMIEESERDNNKRLDDTLLEEFGR